MSEFFLAIRSMEQIVFIKSSPQLCDKKTKRANCTFQSNQWTDFDFRRIFFRYRKGESSRALVKTTIFRILWKYVHKLKSTIFVNSWNFIVWFTIDVEFEFGKTCVLQNIFLYLKKKKSFQFVRWLAQKVNSTQSINV